MLIGAMNHPERDVLDEIKWMGDLGLEFLDLTIEPPAAASWKINTAAVKGALSTRNMHVVGHTAYYLAIESAFEGVRCAAVDELKKCMERFADLDCKWMNVHPGRYTPMHSREYFVSRDIQSLEELIEFGKPLGVGVMVENIPGDFNTANELGELLDPLPDLGLHLDIGHANLQVPYNTTQEIVDRYGDRLRHVHLHDNKGGRADLHLPLGAGTMDWRRQISFLKKCGYDGTITLEVFSHDPHYLSYSAQLLREEWNSN